MARHETEALWAFASGELEAEAQARVADHVAGCEACATKLEQVRQSQAVLSTAREDVPNVRWAEVDDTLQTAAAQRLARLERRPRWPWALAATGALAAVLALVVLRPGTPAPSAPRVAVREQPPTPEVTRPEPPAPVVARQEPPAPVVPPVPQEPAAAPILATRVESATGAWIRDSKARERVLEPGTQLKAGASVRTRAKSNALIQLPDESRVRLSPNSEVTLASTAAEEVQLTVKRGRLSVRASHAARKGFIVEAAGVRASVVGTIFSVERTARGAVVAVLEGKVQVESKGQLPRLVNAGQRVEVIPGKRTPSAKALSSTDRQAFQELGPAPVPRPVSSGSTSVPRPTSPGLATAAVPSEEPAKNAPPAAESPAAPSGTPEKNPGQAAAAPTEDEESGSEFAPYPVPRPEPAGTVVVAPEPVAPATSGDFVPQSPWEPPEPGVDSPGTTDARFLWNAREQLSAATCESFLVGLAEIAEQSTVREFREQARYLRARCFEERLAPAEAKAEYQRYLREFPKGRYVREAKAALLP